MTKLRKYLATYKEKRKKEKTQYNCLNQGFCNTIYAYVRTPRSYRNQYRNHDQNPYFYIRIHIYSLYPISITYSIPVSHTRPHPKHTNEQTERSESRGGEDLILIFILIPSPILVFSFSLLSTVHKKSQREMNRSFPLNAIPYPTYRYMYSNSYRNNRRHT